MTACNTHNNLVSIVTFIHILAGKETKAQKKLKTHSQQVAACGLGLTQKPTVVIPII